MRYEVLDELLRSVHDAAARVASAEVRRELESLRTWGALATAGASGANSWESGYIAARVRMTTEIDRRLTALTSGAGGGDNGPEAPSVAGEAAKRPIVQGESPARPHTNKGPGICPGESWAGYMKRMRDADAPAGPPSGRYGIRCNLYGFACAITRGGLDVLHLVAGSWIHRDGEAVQEIVDALNGAEAFRELHVEGECGEFDRGWDACARRAKGDEASAADERAEEIANMLNKWAHESVSDKKQPPAHVFQSAAGIARSTIKRNAPSVAASSAGGGPAPLSDADVLERAANILDRHNCITTAQNDEILSLSLKLRAASAPKPVDVFEAFDDAYLGREWCIEKHTAEKMARDWFSPLVELAEKHSHVLEFASALSELRRKAQEAG